MLSLDDKRWSELEHAYGKAQDVPRLLRELADSPPCDGYDAEPYCSLWGALCHQGTVYSASYAALPHIVRAMEAAPSRAQWSALLLVASIEIARSKGDGPEMSDELKGAYEDALGRLAQVLAATAGRNWDESFCRVAAASLAAAKGQPDLAEAILELEPGLIQNFMEWTMNQ